MSIRLFRLFWLRHTLFLLPEVCGAVSPPEKNPSPHKPTDTYCSPVTVTCQERGKPRAVTSRRAATSRRAVGRGQQEEEEQPAKPPAWQAATLPVFHMDGKDCWGLREVSGRVTEISLNFYCRKPLRVAPAWPCAIKTQVALYTALRDTGTGVKPVAK